MSMLRHRLLIDNDVQGALLRRAALYGVAFTLYFAVILVSSECWMSPEEPTLETVWRCLDDIVYGLPGVAILTPVVAYDLLRVSNRFSGPIHRLRLEMSRLAEGDEVGELHFRDGDYWIEVADAFNSISEELALLRAEKAVSAASAAEDDAPRPAAQLFGDTDSEADAEPSDDLLVTS